MSAKGKQRADRKVRNGLLYKYDQEDSDPTESTSLLADPSVTAGDEYGTRPTISSPLTRRRRATWIRCFVWFISFVSLTLFFFLLIALYLFSSLDRAPAARRAPLELLAHGIRWETSSVSLNSITEGAVDITVNGELGFDTDWILGVDTDTGVLAPLRRSLTRWAIGRIGDLKVSPTTASLYGLLGTSNVLLANVSTKDETSISVKPTQRGGIVHMQDVHFPLRVHTPDNVLSALKWSNQTWTDGTAMIQVHIPEATVSARKFTWWLPNLSRKERDINTSVMFKLPNTPQGFPSPGEPFALSKALTLVRYSMGISEDDQGDSKIGFSALANLLLPLTQSSLPRLHLPPVLPGIYFQVSLLCDSGGANDTVPFALLSMTPELDNSTSDPNTLASANFPITGSLLPLVPSTVPPLSRLVSHYLSAQPSIIILSSIPLINGSSPLISLPPTPITFPGPSKKPKILRNITVKNMRLNPSKTGDTLVASGTIYATFGLPLGMEDLTPLINVRKIWPDTLIFNGDVPTETPGNSTVGRILMTPGENPLPDPLPERAFARIRPENWIPAHVILPEDGSDILEWDDAVLEDGHMHMEKKKVVTRVVTAEMIDAPLDILPGRDDEFQAFVRKLLSSHGAGVLAGVKGTTAIGLRVEGLTLPPAEYSPAEDPEDGNEQQDIELEGLSFQGRVVVGRKPSNVSESV